ncbi:protoporphyrinogen oxidase [Pontibacter ramchanderi]|uniref:Coproporphyrinogen III oxidase n=1 Tax=Pontibacter ramchanderi TaxID=1179743 RepID=A0A2N3V476_9BACT|nr:protoporphyrinogen oxidase [Pontibacter ramchanderi]PKV76420.1 oxygen-dependent protoporphyrinogen oxidase [Pontibacter ramchanderi]
MRVAIIGAGISGLSLAYYLQRQGVAYDLFEAGSEVGGNMRTLRKNGYTFELGPNTLQMNEELLQLITELKLETELLPLTPRNNKRYVLHKGKLHPVPSSPKCFLANDIFSKEDKYRILQERKQPPAEVENETISDFFERRFGVKQMDYLAAPMISGLYGGDPRQLLVNKAHPELKELETAYGSVLEGMVQRKKRGVFQRAFSFRNGMSTLPEAIADKLISLHLDHKVEFITRIKGKYIISCASNGDHDNEEYDKLVLALPAHQAAELIEFTYPGMAAALQNINYPPMAVVHTVYNRAEVGHPLQGFGALHPWEEQSFTSGSIWTSSLFEGRCRPHEVMLTSFVGGTRFAEHALLNERSLLEQVHRELCETYQIKALAPVYQHVHLWPHAMPQFDLYIKDAHHMAEVLEQDGLFISANWYAGVSVPGCVREAKAIATKINPRAVSRSIAE